jgi:hypothetical protein
VSRRKPGWEKLMRREIDIGSIRPEGCLILDVHIVVAVPEVVVWGLCMVCCKRTRVTVGV